MGTLFGDVVEIGEHLAAEMREDNALGAGFRIWLPLPRLNPRQYRIEEDCEGDGQEHA